MKNKCIQLTVDGAVGFFPKEFIEKAVGKQISKAVNYISEEYNDEGLVYAETSCPICDCYFELDTTNWGTSYCPDCGQALKWGDEE